jgi:hypothetical protein
MSRIVASGVPFLLGIKAAAEELVEGASLAVLFAEGDEDFFGDADTSAFGLGDAVFSVVTETVVSEADASGDAAGDGLSSWATAKRAPATSVVRARMVIFIWFSLVEFGGSSRARVRLSIEGRILGSGPALRQAEFLRKTSGHDRAHQA